MMDRFHNLRLYVHFQSVSKQAAYRNQIASSLPSIIISNKQNNNNNNTTFIQQNRSFSVQSSIESLARNQTGIFKWLSESTPVEYAQNTLVSFHDFTGLPWWASIVCTTVLLRTCITLPLAIYQNYIMARLENLKLEMPAIAEELKKETAVAVKMYKWDERTARLTYNRSIRKQWNQLIIRDNCHPFKASLLLLFQIPMWVSVSVALRNLVYMLPNGDLSAQIVFKELSLGGFAFIPNLTAVDSSLIFPITLGLLNLAIIEIQVMSRVTTPGKVQKVLTNVFRGLSIMMVPIAASVPSCLVLYWTTSSAYGLMQNMLLLSPPVKRAVGIPFTNLELKEPYKHIGEQMKKRCTSVLYTKDS